MSDLPDPLTPAYCDLRGYDFMPLFGHRLFSSSLYLEGTADEFRAAVRLWWAAWNQVPAGSLPTSDGALATLADYGRDRKAWDKVRAMALHGFVTCSDGRLYHPMLCEEVVVAFEKRLKSDAKRKTDRDRLQAWRDARKKRDETPSDESGNAGGNGSETPDETPVKRVSESVDSGQRQRQKEELPSVVVPRRAAATGARLPEDWTPDGAGYAFAVDRDLDPNEVLASFSDYWRAKAGKDGRKSDWPATWRNWCRNEAKRGRSKTTTNRFEAYDRIDKALRFHNA